jgi:chromate transport protein ChrA
LALAVPLSRFTSQVGGGSAFYVRRMSAMISQSRQSLPAWLGVLVWLVTFVSPSAYFVLLLLAERFHVSAPPQAIVWSLFFLIPIVALVICGAVVWRLTKKTLVRMGWLGFTLFAMVIQFGLILFMLRAIIVTRIGYAQ